jgi:hypothetical protein
MKGVHVEDIHEEFGIPNKTTACVTDFGSNFVKCFRLFDAKPLSENDTLADISDASTIRDCLQSEISDEELNEEIYGNMSDSEVESEDDELEFNPIPNLLRKRKKKESICCDLETYCVPYHRRCVCHLLNLIASSYLGNISDRSFIRLFRSVKTKNECFVEQTKKKF